MSTALIAGQTTQSINDKSRKIHPATQPGQVLEITLEELGNFEFDPGNDNSRIPDDVRRLSGATIKLHGYMLPIDQHEKISTFALIPYGLNSCVGTAKPPIQHTVLIHCPPGNEFDYAPGEITVEGELSVGVVKDGGDVIGLFTLERGTVSAAARPK